MREVTEKEEKYFDYLYALRKTGVTNMFGAAPYLVKAFPELKLDDARIVLHHWMHNFDDSRQ